MPIKSTILHFQASKSVQETLRIYEVSIFRYPDEYRVVVFSDCLVDNIPCDSSNSIPPWLPRNESTLESAEKWYKAYVADICNVVPQKGWELLGQIERNQEELETLDSK